MNLYGLELCCPVCRDDFAESAGELACRGCGRRFPIVAGIPDLRVFPDPYIAMEDDRKKGAMLEGRGCETFSSLLDYYYSITSVVPPRHAQLYKRGLLAGPERASRRAGIMGVRFWRRTGRAPARNWLRHRTATIGRGAARLSAGGRGYSLSLAGHG